MNGAPATSGFGVAIMLVACFALMVQGERMLPGPGPWLAGFAFFAYVGGANALFAGELYRARRLARSGQLEAAIGRFERALDHFETFAFVDRWRWVLLFLPTTHPLRASALLGLAHCHAVLERPEALSWFEACVREYPKNGQATAALMLLRLGGRLAARGDEAFG